ncbi:MAG: family 10 glycosylhydrolase, partial [Anaerolineales bacterium]|nr:family 10 glycosylhydrolase [Anaerolineales bacterium]
MTTIQTIGNSIWVYPWDLFDNGLERALDEIARAGLDSISVAATYHAARLLLPHNPRRKVLTLEPDAAYFQPDPAMYANLPSPRRAREFATRDPLREICDAAAQRGLGVQAWTIFLHNSTLGEQRPDLTVVNCFGDHYVHALCPSNPIARAYALALGADIARHYPIAALDVEALGFLGYAHNSHHDKASIALAPLHHFMLSVCFCDHCAEKIRAAGADAQTIHAAFRRELQAWFDGNRRLATVNERAGLIELIGEKSASALLDARTQIVASLIAELRNAVPKQVALQIRAASTPFHVGGKTAGDLRSIAQHADGFVFSFFGMPFAKFQSEVESMPRDTLRDKPLWGGISVANGLPECQDENDFRQR